MKSSSGQYFQSLDHVRAIAVFTIFVWHFIHFDNGQLASPLVFPFSFFTEGHTGVAIFMTLSGYLFAKLLDGKRFNYFAFLRNRFLRLAPLLIVYIGNFCVSEQKLVCSTKFFSVLNRNCVSLFLVLFRQKRRVLYVSGLFPVKQTISIANLDFSDDL